MILLVDTRCFVSNMYSYANRYQKSIASPIYIEIFVPENLSNKCLEVFMKRLPFGSWLTPILKQHSKN